MLARDLIAHSIPVVKTSDTGNDVLNWMDNLRVSHLPIVNNEEFLGLISDTDIFDNNIPDEPIGNHRLSLVRPFVYEKQHILEIIELVSKLNISVVPVLEINNKYLGAITLQKLVTEFSKLISIEKAGAIIILEMTIHDYSLSEISQIIESNNAKVMCLYVSSSDQSTQINVTIKLDVTDMTSILKTFERYDYTVKASFLSEDILKVFYQDRYDSFINFLNI